ncbi:MAG TPA: class I SAM-dependent methyltransferase [Drouetiella sp.]|jgi:SAM-dependent methyltransferase
MTTLYNIPLLYDIAFRRAGLSYQVDGLVEIHQRFRSDHQLQSVLELASGPSRHALEFARRDYDVSVVDNSEAMCEYATKLAQESSLTVDVNCADMRNFEVPGRFDLAMIVLNSIGHIHECDDLTSHLHSVWRQLKPQGLYVIEAHYPPWTSRKSLNMSSWRVEMSELSLRVDFGTSNDEFDLERKVRKLQLHIDGQLRGEPLEFSDYLIIRSWSAEVLESIINESNLFRIETRLSALDLSYPFDAETASRLVFVLKKIDAN